MAFIYQPDPHLPDRVEVDEKRLRQVLINLLSNALKFTEAGSVTLLVEVLSCSATRVFLQFQVIDTGMGVDEQDLPKLFQSFERVGNRQKEVEGTGLGLAISQRIVQLMGGTIQVESQLGQGSTFSFDIQLPLAQNSASPQDGMDGRHSIIGYQGPRQTILVVDDHWENRAVPLQLLEPLDFRILEANDGRDGLATLRNTPIDLVILDLTMPIMDGYEFLQQVRASETLKHTKIIVSSASASPAEKQLALERGADGFLSKPIDAKLLLRMLAKHLSIEWVHEKQSKVTTTDQQADQIKSDTMVSPNHEVLQKLLTLTQDGDIQGLKLFVEKELGSQPSLIQFTEQIMNLVNSFQLKQLKAFIEKAMG